MKRPRVLLADDHTLFLDVFAKLLASHCDIVGTVKDGQALLRSARRLQPDVIVVDICMPLLNGLEAGPRLREMLPRTKLIYLTAYEEPELAAQAMRAGAAGFLLKSCAASELLKAIREAVEGRVYVTPRLAGNMEQRPAEIAGSLPELSSRQREILRLLAKGRSTKEIGEMLGVTAHTVAWHRRHLMGLFGVRTTAELVQSAVRHRLVEP
jgi:DNA-binding NarL/FixJ family response regulator